MVGHRPLLVVTKLHINICCFVGILEFQLLNSLDLEHLDFVREFGETSLRLFEFIYNATWSSTLLANIQLEFGLGFIWLKRRIFDELYILAIAMADLNCSSLSFLSLIISLILSASLIRASIVNPGFPAVHDDVWPSFKILIVSQIISECSLFYLGGPKPLK